MINSAIILAGGNGTRMKSDIPKQFKVINNKMILEYSLKEFSNNKYIDEIILVCAKTWVNKIKKKYPYVKIVHGGKSRSESSFIGLKSCNPKTKNVLIHDSARPLINQKIINLCIQNLTRYDTSIPIINCDDSLINTDTMQYLNRDLIKIIQTPQGFNYKKIFNAYNEILSSKSGYQNIFNDDLSLLLNYLNDVKCCFYNGNKSNFKITNKEDLIKFESLLKC